MTENQGQIATRAPAREVRIVEDNSAIGYLMDTSKFEHMQRLAAIMASASLTPKHLKGANAQESMANCFRVANQAIRWGFDPFAIMDETYVVHGRLGYQGKLVAAVVNARAGLVSRLTYTFQGNGDARSVTVRGRFEGEDFDREITLSVGQAKTDNKMWQTDPDQKLVYSGVTKWARRHCPEILLGVLTDDDLERIEQESARITVPQTGRVSLRQNGRNRMIEAESPPEPPVTNPLSEATPTGQTEPAVTSPDVQAEEEVAPPAPSKPPSPMSYEGQFLVKIEQAETTGELDDLRVQISRAMLDRKIDAEAKDRLQAKREQRYRELAPATQAVAKTRRPTTV